MNSGSTGVADTADIASRWELPAMMDGDPRDVVKAFPRKIPYVQHDSFTSPDAEERHFGPQSQDIQVPCYTLFPEVPEEVSSTHMVRTSLSTKNERSLFLRYNYAKYRLQKLLSGSRQTSSRRRIKEVMEWHRRAIEVRTKLLWANLALVPAMATRTRISSVEFGELISEGNMALLRSIERFDVSRGFKFSTYACSSILKSFHRLAGKAGRYRDCFPVRFDPELEHSDFGTQRHERQREDSIDTIRDILSRNQARLSPVEQTIIMERFAISTRSKGRTLAEVGKVVGLTNERVRQIQQQALSKIRTAVEKQWVV